jgi:hypothetical protein
LFDHDPSQTHGSGRKIRVNVLPADWTFVAAATASALNETDLGAWAVPSMTPLCSDIVQNLSKSGFWAAACRQTSRTTSYPPPGPGTSDAGWVSGAAPAPAFCAPRFSRAASTSTSDLQAAYSGAISGWMTDAVPS